MSDTAAILLAGGSGRRMGQAGADKVLIPLLGKAAILHSMEAFARSGEVARWIIVVRDEEQKEAIQSQLTAHAVAIKPEAIQWVPGGAERQDSVLAALEAVDAEETLVLIHDAARPLITAKAIRAVTEAARVDGAAVLAHPVVDTIKQLSNANETRRVEAIDLDRSRLWAMETPQVFRCGEIRRAYRRVRDEGLQVTDDAAAHVANGGRVTLVANPLENRKLTLPEDITVIEALLKSRT